MLVVMPTSKCGFGTRWLSASSVESLETGQSVSLRVNRRLGAKCFDPTLLFLLEFYVFQVLT